MHFLTPCMHTIKNQIFIKKKKRNEERNRVGIFRNEKNALKTMGQDALRISNSECCGRFQLVLKGKGMTCRLKHLHQTWHSQRSEPTQEHWGVWVFSYPPRFFICPALGNLLCFQLFWFRDGSQQHHTWCCWLPDCPWGSDGKRTEETPETQQCNPRNVNELANI